MLLEKASKNKDKKLGFLDEIRWGRGQGVPGAQPVNAQKIRNNPITGPKLGGGEWVRGQTRFCQKPKFVRFFFKAFPYVLICLYHYILLCFKMTLLSCFEISILLCIILF